MAPPPSGTADRHNPQRRRGGRACCSRRDARPRRWRCSIRWRAAQADSVADLVALRARLGQLVQSTPTADARALEALFRHVLDAADVQEGGQFRTAELVRDSLVAPHLAGRLFVGFAQAHPGSPFAPKAMVAPLALLPSARDSLVAAL